MIMDLYNFEESIGWDFYDIPSLVLLGIIVIIAGVHFYKQHKRKKRFEEEEKENITD